MHSVTKDLKTAQTMLRHSKPEMTAGTYIQGVPEENLKAWENSVFALVQEESSRQQKRNSLMPVSDLFQLPHWAGIEAKGEKGLLTFRKEMVGPNGLEPLTSTVSILRLLNS